MERPLHIFGADFQSNFFLEQMFREEHYHMTLSNETPPQTFSEICSIFFFGTAISQNSSVRLHARKLIFVWLAKWLFCGRVVQEHGDILNSSNNSMFLLQKSIEIGKFLISSASREFEWSPKGKSQNLLAQILWLLPEHW